MLWSCVFSNLFPSINLFHLFLVNKVQGFGADYFRVCLEALVELGSKSSAYTQGGTL